MEEMCRRPVVKSLMGGTLAAVPDRYKTVSAQDFSTARALTGFESGANHEDYVPQPLAEQVRERRHTGGRSSASGAGAGGWTFRDGRVRSRPAWPVVREAIRSVLLN
jgi:hypothetical protein